MKKFCLTFFLLVIFFTHINNIYATSAPNEATASNINYNDINNQLSNIEKNIQAGNTSDFIKTLNSIQDEVSKDKQNSETSLGFVEKRIEALGAIPENGVREPYAISSKRKTFANEQTALKTKITEADLVLAKISELEKMILSIRNKALLNNILNRQTSIIKPNSIIQNTEKFIGFIYDIFRSPIDWYNSLSLEDKKSIEEHSLYIGLTAIISLIIAASLSIFFKKKFGYRNLDKDPNYIKKILAAIFEFVALGVIPAMVIGAFLFWVRHSAISDSSLFSLVISQFLIYLLYIFIAKVIVKIVFVPDAKYSKWRLIKVNDLQAKAISFAIYLTVILISIVAFLQYIAVKKEYPMELILYVKFISCMVKTFCIILITNIVFRNEANVVSDSSNMTIDTSKSDDSIIPLTAAAVKASESINEDEDYGELTLGDKIKLSMYIFAIVVFSISIFGYINLSDYILNRSFITIIFIGIAYILSNTISVLFHKILLLRFWSRTLKIRRRTVAKIDIWFGLILNPIIILVTIFVLLGLWGVSTDLLLQNIKRFLTGFYIGGVKVSITSILLGILVYFISMSIFRIIKIKLLLGTLSKMDMNSGAKESLASGFSFFGFLASVLFAIAVMGGSFSNIAIIAGALSFGVGLGLQNIINNFVSGLLILFERPIKIGDIVNINGQEGIVKQINIRATELETGTKSSVIIPNANIISGVLLNKTHNNRQTRIDLNFIVSNNNNPKDVMKILISVAEENKKVLNKPSPFVLFNNFLNNNLDFTLSCYIMDIGNRQNVINELMVEVFNKFNEANIKLPEKVVYVRNPNNILNE